MPMIAFVTTCALAFIVLMPPDAMAGKSYSADADVRYPVNVYWGDTHLHTCNSDDAYTFGNRTCPAEAYKFAKGQAVKASNGETARLRRPLDFLVIADHDYNLGIRHAFEAKDSTLLRTSAARKMLRRFASSGWATEREELSSEIMELLDIATENESFRRTVWEQVVQNAERFNEPGKFSAFIAYEWTSMGSGYGATFKASREMGTKPAAGNLHRVVIFKDGADKAGQIIPLVAGVDGQDPRRLWAYLAAYEATTGGEVLAIPHNGNVSNGEMFSFKDFDGRAIDRAQAERRMRWEPLYEVTQFKGDSETHQLLSPTDEFADYETWNSWRAKNLPAGREWGEAEVRIKEGEYARYALRRGLVGQADLGANPFKFGVIGGTDSHSSLSSVDEESYWGNSPRAAPGNKRLLEDPFYAGGPYVGWVFAASGNAGIWAEANTREALFAAMKRRETYATTGPRITVRFFGGWEFSNGDALRPDLARIGYAKGVPMGGDLTNAPAGRAPKFLIRAVKDPDGANLDRVQVIKGWLDSNGETHERIYDVALSDDRKVGPDGKAPPVGSTVNVADASYTNRIGDPELAVVWEDQDFDRDELAFYYVRILEIPTPRWSAYDAKQFNLSNLPDGIPMVHQERAYTSPIWYTP